MNPDLLSKQCDRKGNKIIVAGFEGVFNDCLIYHNAGESDLYEFKEFENSFVLFRFLENATENDAATLPAAIVCEFASLEEEQFLLLRNLRNHPTLKFIPIIAMNRDGLNHKLRALNLGFDDYYDVPVQWSVLKERIAFLSAFKKQIQTCELGEQEQLEVKISSFKRALDIIIALAVIILFSPVLLLIALLIKLESPGPIIYRSKRVGTGYHVFDFLKFRSMYRDADQRLKDLQHLNQYNGQENGSLFVKFNNDPRVTKVGRLIRKTSIDELPQLFNVLKGDMSVVGNRPLPLYEAEQLTRDLWARRFLAPAGLTGLWQVSKRGKNDMSTEERIGLDVDYAEKHSFWFDLKIMAKTPFALIQDENV